MDALQVAKKLFAAVEAGDVETVRNLYAPEFRIWHNYDGVAQTAEENLGVLGWLVANVSNRRYENVRLEKTESGFVQQHVLRGTLASGEKLELPACMVGIVKDGKVVRLDEYFDPAHLGSLQAGLQGS